MTQIKSMATSAQYYATGATAETKHGYIGGHLAGRWGRSRRGDPRTRDRSFGRCGQRCQVLGPETAVQALYIYCRGVPIALLAGGEARFLEKLTPEAEWSARNALVRRQLPAVLHFLS